MEPADSNQIGEEYKLAIQESTELSMNELRDGFNQEALDLLNYLSALTRKHNLWRESNIAHNTAMLRKAIEINRDLPISMFTQVAMEHTHKIFARDEEYFQHLEIPEGNVGEGAALTFIKPEVFKQLGNLITLDQKDQVHDHVTLMATFACAYFVKSAKEI